MWCQESFPPGIFSPNPWADHTCSWLPSHPGKAPRAVRAGGLLDHCSLVSTRAPECEPFALVGRSDRPQSAAMTEEEAGGTAPGDDTLSSQPQVHSPRAQGYSISELLHPIDGTPLVSGRPGLSFLARFTLCTEAPSTPSMAFIRILY